jgi:glyoxylase-like metal-dependent hydrolase (beta-lactamase superfamily II)
MNQVTQLGFINAYLVEEEDGLTLVDTGMGGNAKRLIAAASAVGRPIVRILLTHAHDDHVGSLDALHAALPTAEVLISARDARLLAGDLSRDPGEPQQKLKGGLKGAKTAPTRLLAPGDRVGSLEVHAAPGHTPGQIALLDVRDRSLYCGDAFATVGGVATCAKPRPWFPLPGFATWDKPLSLQTAKALRALDPARLAPGHGRVVEAPAAAMDAAIARGA